MHVTCCQRGEKDFIFCAPIDHDVPITCTEQVLNSGRWTRSVDCPRAVACRWSNGCMTSTTSSGTSAFIVLSVLCVARMTGLQALRCPQRSCCLRTQGPQRIRVAATRRKVANRTRTHELRAAITQAAVIEKEEGDREGGTGMYMSPHRQ